MSFGSPFSKRALASVRRPTERAVLRTLTGLNMADSSQILVVLAFTPLSLLPITPARAMGWSWQVTS